MIGRSLGHYCIVERLGAGGMGEVYRARDEKLGRDVALKVLPSGALADEDTRRRFRREAEALSRLSHPHIASLFDADCADGTDFLVMELVPGATLEEKLRRGPLEDKEAVRLGAQLARGLMAAHERGVIHRDLKPSNLGLTEDGLLKVLDFGVAQLERGVRASPDDATTTHTGPGSVVGSPPYMSPEQLLGREVDSRTDIYSAGAVLYELVTGKRPFAAMTGVELHDAVLHEAPAPPRELNGRITPGLEAVILKALDKDKALRYQSARELLVDLERMQAGASGAAAVSSPSETARSRSRARPGRWVWAVLVVAIAAGAVGLVWPPPPIRIAGIRPVTRGVRNADLLWASDATNLYYSTVENDKTRYYQVPIAGGDPAEIPIPFRYGEILSYLPRRNALLVLGSETPPTTERGAGLWLASVPGGSVSRIGDLPVWFAAASPDEERLALTYGSQADRRIGVASFDGSGLREVARAGPFGAVAWAPDGHRLRFVAPGPPSHEREPWHWDVSTRGGPVHPLFAGTWGQWTPNGRHYVFGRRDYSRVLWRGADLWVARDARWPPWGRAPSRFSVGPLHLNVPGFSPDGRLFAWGLLPRGELSRVNTKAGRLEPFLGGISAHYVDVSADGRWAVYVTHPEGELWMSRVDGSGRRRLTPAGTLAVLPRWSPDGQSIAYVAQGPGDDRLTLRRVLSDGTGHEVLAGEPGQNAWDVCWLPDGESLVFSHLGPTLFGAGRPGLLTVDLRTRRVSPLPGADKLLYPKCSRRGDVMAQDPEHGSRKHIRRRGRTDWEPVDIPLAYANWTRDGEAIIGFDSVASRAVRFSLKTRTSTPLADLPPLVVLLGVPWMGLDAEDSPIVLREHGVWDLYEIELATGGRGW